ncbi:hypothetical protein A2303_01140 [Candidatus Falkowbacteria bacterium RIFOXYB2_FULL_47_14]|uniref:Uncharacterized protein n=1 Tax=Candidatus Falkowbacteria bacterium RIFOXYA2_FULL_47_19 TaxID=1797994 RepID=A0A1F5SGG5_9BACT|nr:MAG: hypothetical protein A2227_00340 [Candidatus Falkowbacteria bacterium RIFOXYA2_FULL_47_19]OGF35548.1 MAG: hypothetical protein A2468_05935 [Candidatus Falkowbacteria bacterium RIFOXYC2_FULL_46_15]OGF42969.1 MAG: hypothetical protein A2303_01140 [Candidatus Falkowbacteria bacterium RIFOXYB2_FULL_47_14]
MSALLKWMRPITDYLKYDNNYWTRERVKALGKRCLIYFLLLFIVFVYYAVLTGLSPSQAALSAYRNIKPGITAMSRDFPARLHAYAGWYLRSKSLPDEKKLREYFDDPELKRNIRSLIGRDKLEKYSELGGAVMLRERSGKKYFYFHVIESENLALSRKIRDSMGDREELVVIIDANIEEFKDLYGSEELFKKVYGHIKNGTAHKGKKDYFLYDAIDLYLSISDSRYNLTSDEIITEVFYPFGPDGFFLGTFHIHDIGGPPSDNDFLHTDKHPEFVISSTSSGFMVYVLSQGVIIHEIDKKY